MFFITIYSSWAQQPSNNNCQNASLINFDNGNFGIGTFTSDSFLIDSATIQNNEWFHSSLVAAGNDKKSIWYKFYLPARRGVEIELRQYIGGIDSRDVGFTTYLSDSCLPGATSATNAKITAINQIGSSSHPCLDPGWYLVQLSAKSAVTGGLFLRITTTIPYQNFNVNNATLDVCSTSYNFGDTIVGRKGWQTKSIDFNLGCYSIKDSSEYFAHIGNNFNQYTQLAWFNFTSVGSSDYAQIRLNQIGGSPLGITDTFAFRLYEGDCDSSLSLIDSGVSNFGSINRCASDNTSDWVKHFDCYFDSGRVYTFQFLFHHSLDRNIRLILNDRTSEYDSSNYQPINQSAKNLGLINNNGFANFGFSCNSNIAQNSCLSNSMTNSVNIRGSPLDYNMNQWMRFSLSQFSSFVFNISAQSSSLNSNHIGYRIFKDSATNNCSDVDTNNIIFEHYGASNVHINCLEPGNYVIQLLGTDSILNHCDGGAHLGGDYRLNWIYDRQPARSKFSLDTYRNVDTINNRVPLTPSINYAPLTDTIACNDAPMPEVRCGQNFNKSIYRTFEVSDSGLLRLSSFLNFNSYLGNIEYASSRLYKGDALQLSINQNITNSSDTINGLSPWGKCFNATSNYCIEPGVYTIATFTDEAFIGVAESPRVRFETNRTKFNTYQTASFIDTLFNNRTYYSEYDTFSCATNRDTIDGVFCGSRNLYYTFYVDSISAFSLNLEDWDIYQRVSLFSGNIKNGKSDLKLVQNNDGIEWSCRSNVSSISTSECNPLMSGWYTVVVTNNNEIAYDSAKTDQTFNARLYGNNGGGRLRIVTRSPSSIPRQYDRPYKAAFVDSLINNNLPLSHDTNYSNRIGMPQHKAQFALPQEIFECGIDSPFHNFPDSLLCLNNTTDVAYYVFNLSKPSYAYIHSATTGGTLKVKMYDFDVRTDSNLLTTTQPIQDCNYDGRFVEFCNLQPGVYTLVYFISREDTQRVSLRPIITLDTVFQSRFDHAKDMYDFGRIPGSGLWYNAKIGDIHPLDTNLPASHDVITCKTGSQPLHPNLSDCFQEFNPYIYRTDINTPSFPYDSSFYRFKGEDYYNYGIVAPLRNLWYTFTIKGRGKVSVTLESLGEKFVANPFEGLRWSVYESNVDGEADLTNLIANGQFDSTETGLRFIGNSNPGWCRGRSQNVSFEISNCEPVRTRRYVVIVHTNHNYRGLNANYHVCPKIKYDSIILEDTRFDYYSTANLIDPITEINLVSNPGAEQNLNSWTTLNNATTTNLLKNTIQRSFYGNGFNNIQRVSSISQNIDISNFASFVSSGLEMTFSFSYLTQILPNRNEDELRAIVYFMNSTQTIDSVLTNWLSSNDIWQFFNENHTLPNNTSSLRIVIEFRKNNTDPTWGYRYQYSYAYIDDINISLRLNNPPSQRPILVSGNLYQGEQSYFAGSTLDTTDVGKVHNNANCSNDNAGTIWYKFKVDSTGYLHYNLLYTYDRDDETYQAYTTNNQFIRLFKSTLDGDSIYGLDFIPAANNSSEFSGIMGSSASKVCVSPGYYYFQINRCNLIRCEDFVIPQVVVDYAKGDYCSTAESLILDSLEQQFATLLVNCHTIGESYGEDGSDMGCLFGPDGYKSSWFKIDYRDTATVDLEFRLANNTTSNSADIRYRTYYGNCQTLTAAPCNNNALTAFTLDCVREGTYFVQVVTPENAIGEVTLRVEAKENSDSACFPVDIFQPVASFSYNANCPENLVHFTNFSSRGDSIRYDWDFGFNGRIDSVMHPSVLFPATNLETNYDVRLITTNIIRNLRDTFTERISIAPTPEIFIHNNDTNLCLGESVTLSALINNGIGYWNTLDTANSITVSKTGMYYFMQIQKPNILQNGSGENILSGDWTQVSGTWSRRSSNPNPVDGTHYISSNHSNNRNAGIFEITQTINVAFDSLTIDSGLAMTSLKGYIISGDETVTDEGQIILEYRDALDSIISFYRSDFIGNSNDWVELVHSRITPVGTRSLLVRLKANNRINNTECMVYFDGLEVRMQSACEYYDSVYVQINPIPELSLPSDTLICPNTELSLAPQYLDYHNPYLNFDPFTGSGTSSSFYYDGFYNPSLEYAVLTEDVAGNRSGAVEWINNNLNINDSFDIDFEFYTKSKITGSTGEAIFFYLFNSQVPTSDSQSGNGGYTISLNKNDSNSISLYWNGNLLHKVYTNHSFTYDTWNKVNIVYENQTFNVFLNGRLVMTYSDISRSQAGFRYGISAFTTTSNYSEHRIRNVFVTKNNNERVVLTPRTERSYQYFWSDGNANEVRLINQPGLYNLYIVDGFGCISNSDSIEIDVYPYDLNILADTPLVCNQLDSFLYPMNDSSGVFIGNDYIDTSGWVDVAQTQSGLNEVVFSYINTVGCPQIDTGYFERINARILSIDPVLPLCVNSPEISLSMNDNNGNFFGGSYISPTGLFNPSLANIGSNKVYYSDFDSLCPAIDSIEIWVDAIPNAAIQPAGPFCANDEVQTISPELNFGYFTNTTYIDSSGNFDPRISGSGSFMVYHNITDGNGCSNIDSTIVNVDTIPNARIQPAGPFCANDEVQTISPELNFGYFTNTAHIDSSGNFDPRISGSGSFMVYHNITDENGCSNIDSTIVNVDTIPNARIQPAGPFCLLEEITQILPVLSGGIFTATNYIDSYGVFDPANANIGDNIIFYQITDGNNCSNRDSFNIVVYENPDASIYSVDPYCENNDTFRIITANENGRFLTENYITQDGVFNPEISGAGLHKVVYSIINQWNCSASDSTFVLVHPVPTNNLVVNPLSGCSPLSTQISTDPINIVYWEINEQNSGSFYDTSILFEEGRYEVNLTVTNEHNCEIELSEIIESLPSPFAEFISDKDSALLGDAKIVFTDLSTGDIVIRDWSFGDGSYSSITNPIKEYLDTGVFEVQLVVENNVGCRDIADGIIVIEHAFSFFIPNAFTPNGDGLNDLFRPVGHRIVSMNCKIFNRWGEKILDETNFKSWDGTYQGKPVQDGVYLYMISVRDFEGKVHNRSGQVHVLR